MKPSPWERLITRLENTFFLEVIVTLMAFIVLYIAIRSIKKEKLSFLFVVYSLSCITLFAGVNIQKFFFPLNASAMPVFTEILNAAFAISELSVFFIFFSKAIESKSSKKIIVSLVICFVISIIYFILKIIEPKFDVIEIRKASVVVNIVEFAALLIAILLYFIQLFTKPPTLNLIHRPSFWISSGLFIYILVSLPLLLFSEHVLIPMNIYYLLFVFHYVSLTLLLLTISKAFLCELPITI